MRPWAEKLAVWLLVLGTVSAPVALGASHQWTRFSLELSVVVSSILWALTARRPMWLQVLPACASCIGLIQVLPLPEAILTTIAPVSAGAWKVASAGLTNASATISVDTHASVLAAARLFTAVSVTAVVASVTRFRPYRVQLIAAVVVVGVVSLACGAVFGHASTPQRLLLGLFPLGDPGNVVFNSVAMPVESAGVGSAQVVEVGGLRYPADIAHSGDGFGTYIYSNHFAGGITLTLPLVVAAWLVFSRSRVPELIQIGVAVAAFSWAIWLVGVGAHSRAGAVALAFSGLALAAFSARRQWLTRVMVGCVIGYTLLAAGGLALMLAPSDLVLGWMPEKYRSIVDVLVTDARNVAAQVAVRMFLASPILGTGLDTYSGIYPRFTQNSFVLFYAHNDIAQWLAETGLFGVGLASAGLAVLLSRFRRFCSMPQADERLLFAGCWAALAGITMHSAFDWNLHLPANAFLAAVIAGLAVASAPSQVAPGVMSKGMRFVAPGVPIAFTLMCGLTVPILYRDGWSQSALKMLRRATAQARSATSTGQEESCRASLEHALEVGEHMAEWDPRNAQLAMLMGQASLHQAAVEVDPLRRESQASQAEKWFAVARTSSAVVRGIPAASLKAALKTPR